MKKDVLIDNSNKMQKETQNVGSVRNPKQTRSIETKEKVMKTASELFCTNGFHKTTTNEIAKLAGLPIGSLYSYFKNKEMILLQILDNYNQTFLDKINSLSLIDNPEFSRKDKKGWIKKIIQTLINIHEETKELNMELKALYYSVPEVAAVHNAHNHKINKYIIDELKYFKDDLNVTDVETAAIIIYDIIDSVVERVVFDDALIDSERIINEGIEAIYKYLYC